MEDKCYDPLRSELLEENTKAYEPGYVLSDSEESLNDVPTSVYHNSHSTQASTPDGYHKKNLTQPSPYGSDSDTDSDREYRVKPLIDVYTPSYAPSQPFDSASNSSLSSNLDNPVSPNFPDGNDELDHDPVVTPVPTKVIEEGSATFIKSSSPTYTGLRESPRQLASDREPDNISTLDNDADNANEEFEGFEREDQPESQVNGIIADIFGESDAEEEFEGFAENEIDKGVDEIRESDHIASPVGTSPKADAVTTDAQKEEGSSDEDGNAFVSDFDVLMERRREENRRKRRRNHDIEFLNDADDLIISLISRMKTSANEDRQLLSLSQPATKKLKMLNEVVSMLRRADFKSALVENGMMAAITEWLSPLPGHILPNLRIRDELLKCLNEFASLGPDILQESGIGKAVMYLHKHPLETRENRERAGRLVNCWLRPIFNRTCDYRTLTREERKEMDHERLPKRRPISDENYDRRDINRDLDGEAKGALRPGDPGWIGRARVPQPSTKDYINRPKWDVGSRPHRRGPVNDDDDDEDNEDEDQNNDDRKSTETPHYQAPMRKFGSSNSGAVGTLSRLERNIRTLSKSARQSHSKMARAVTMSIGGNKMAL